MYIDAVSYTSLDFMYLIKPSIPYFEQQCYSVEDQGPDGLGAPPVSLIQSLRLSGVSLHFKEPLTALLISTFSPFSQTQTQIMCISVLTLYVCLFLVLSLIFVKVELSDLHAIYIYIYANM